MLYFLLFYQVFRLFKFEKRIPKWPSSTLIHLVILVAIRIRTESRTRGRPLSSSSFHQHYTGLIFSDIICRYNHSGRPSPGMILPRSEAKHILWWQRFARWQRFAFVKFSAQSPHIGLKSRGLTWNRETPPHFIIEFGDSTIVSR